MVSAQQSRHGDQLLLDGEPHDFCSEREQFCEKTNIYKLLWRGGDAFLASGAPKQQWY